MNLLDLYIKLSCDDQASGQIDRISSNMVSKMGSAAAKVAKFVAGAFATKKIIDFGKESLQAYGQFEQMAGGVERLYGKMASTTVQNNAIAAWRTAQMGVNDYLETATAFSGRLIRELGDSELAAGQVDTAVRTLADSYNTYGTDVGLQIQALSSIARGSYRMLDTLTNNVYSEGKASFEQFMNDARDYASKVSNMTYEEYAESMKKTGLSADELSKRYETLKNSTDLSNESFSDIITALSITNERTGILGTTTKEALSTIQGSTLAAKAAWDNLLLELGKPNGDISARVSDLMQALFGEVQDNGERMYGLVNNYKNEITTIISNWMNAIPQIVDGVLDVLPDDVRSRVEKVVGVVSDFASKVSETFDLSVISERFGMVVEAIASAFDSFMATVDFGYLNVIIEKLGSILEQVWGFVETNILPHVPAIGTAIGEVVNFLLSLASTVLTVIDNLGPFVPMILGAVAGIKGFMIVQEIIGMFTMLGTAIGSITTIVATFGGPLATIAAMLGGWPVLLAAVVGAIAAFLLSNEEARQKIAEIYEAIKQAVTETLNAVASYLSSKWAEITSSISNYWNESLSKTTEWLNNTKQRVSEAFTNVVQTVTNAGRSVVSFITTAWNTAVQTVTNAVSRIRSGVQSGFNSVVSFVRGIPQKIKSALGNLGSLLWNAGTSVIRGLLNGMKSAISGVYNWVSGIAGRIASLKGPLPYDLKVLIPNGKALMTGLQKGLSIGFEDDVKPYVESMAGEMSNAFDVPSVSASGYATQKSGPTFNLTIGSLTVRGRDDAYYFADRINEIWKHEVEGSLA